MKQLLCIMAISLISCNQNNTSEQREASISDQSATLKKIVDEKNALAVRWYKEKNMIPLLHCLQIM